MKSDTKGVSKTGGQVFGSPLQTLAAEELDRVFGGQAGPPAPTPPVPAPTPSPTPWGPWQYKNRGGYDYYGQES